MTIRDEATVTVREAVYGLPTRRRTGGNRMLASRVQVTQVHPLALAAAQAALRPGERLVFVSETEIRTVYR